ncbi:MAG: hypothetical protein F4Z68_09290 [Nitrospira sp. SB0667_bin_9]|nr:hypothetical protein [Nitrospira sp. SB0667_bin_9]MYD31591.1 hypothetical protein [Nitrospira sp. SB0661_bin_20]MYJ23769.1 hypothetical protein [Nitrospira sp. SB0673_bin_12]
MGRGTSRTTSALGFPGCSIFDITATANISPCGRWPCIVTFGCTVRRDLKRCRTLRNQPGNGNPDWRRLFSFQRFPESFLENIAVFAATPWEFNAIGRALPASRVERINGVKWRQWANASRFVAVIQTGIGLVNARAACEAVCQKRPWTVFISSGFAGALVPSRIGDVVIPEQVVCADSSLTGSVPGSSIVCSASYRQQAYKAAQLAGNAVLSGRLVTVGSIVWLTRDKLAIGRTFESSSLDMESAAIGSMAALHGIPFCVTRSVSDRLEEDLPFDLNLFRRAGTFAQGVWAVAATPGKWSGFNQLRRQKNVASARLSQFFEIFFSMTENSP